MTRRAWILFTAMSVLWGLPYLLIKVAVNELEPVVVVFVRLAMAAIVLLPIAIASGTLKKVRPRWRLLVTMAIVGIVVPFVLIAYGEQHITSSLAALLIASDPLFIVLLALRVDPSERATGARLLGLLLGLLGVAALVGPDLGGDTLGVLGAGLILLSAACYAVSALLVKRLGRMPMLGSVAITLTVAAVALAPIAATKMPTHMPSVAAIASVLALGLLCTALAYVIYYNLISEAGATRASLITYVNPAVAVLLGVLVLSEPLTLGMILGFGLIIVGCSLSTGAVGSLRQSVRTRRIRPASA